MRKFLIRNVAGLVGVTWLSVGFWSMANIPTDKPKPDESKPSITVKPLVLPFKSKSDLKDGLAQEVRPTVSVSDLNYSVMGDNERRLRAFFKDNPIMVKVAYCESKFIHRNKDGSILRGEKDPYDIGIMQINTRTKNGHRKKSLGLGLDIWTMEGSMAYAKILSRERGLGENKDEDGVLFYWRSSSGCWGPHRDNPGGVSSR